MSLLYLISTALTTAFVLGAAANLSTSVKAILRYRNTQRNYRKTGSVSMVPPSLSTRYPHTFTAVVITHCAITTGSALAFAVLMQERGDPWSTYLSSSIIVSSMIREHFKISPRSNRQREDQVEARISTERRILPCHMEDPKSLDKNTKDGTEANTTSAAEMNQLAIVNVSNDHHIRPHMDEKLYAFEVADRGKNLSAQD
ncbi:hypothetical protein B0J13DRAFT_533629 [Dactylonectria estremocensis]|uniref:Uncharacterized protein n=1 Tax=Dactylonectria estremocensis TaxID=1079267 RepID=A0A9P9D921_9HYPO|nr:hypothetical protein B0J13DRAFT_533629 [Dactylonectria estremocensis]